MLQPLWLQDYLLAFMSRNRQLKKIGCFASSKRHYLSVILYLSIYRMNYTQSMLSLCLYRDLYGLKVLFCWGVAANKEQSLNKILIFVHQNYQFSSPKLSARVVAKTDEWISTRLTGKKVKRKFVLQIVTTTRQMLPTAASVPKYFSRNGLGNDCKV